jgi:hypothetical protein
MKPHLPLLVIAVLFLVLVFPVAGECGWVSTSLGTCEWSCNPPDIGNFSTGQPYHYTSYYDPTAAGANQVVYNISFQHIENFADFNSLMTGTSVAYVYPDWGAGYTAGAYSNDSTESVTLIHDGQVISTGRLSYAIETVSGAYSPIYISYIADTWSPGARTGTVNALIQYPDSAGTGDRWRLHTGSAIYGASTNTSVTMSTVYFGMNFGTSPIAATLGPNYRWYTYYSYMRGGYERIVGEGSVDTYKIDKCFETGDGTVSCHNFLTEVSYYDYQFGWTNVTRSTSNKTTLAIVPKNRNVRLRMTDPFNTLNEWYWMYCGAGDLNISVSKGSVPNFPAAVGEYIDATALYGGDVSQVGSVIWRWSRNGGNKPPTMRIFVKNQSNGTWEDDYQVSSTQRGAYNFETQVMKQSISFLLDDYDGNWSAPATDHNAVSVSLGDLVGNPVQFASKIVYVGSAARSTLQFEILYGLQYLTNANLWVKDETTGYMYTGEQVASGRVINRSTLNHSYVVWANHLNYTFGWACINSAAQNFCSKDNGQPANANTINFTTMLYGYEYVYIQMLPKSAGLVNATFTVHVIDANTNDPLEGAVVKINYDYGVSTYFTNEAGEVKLLRMIAGKAYSYEVSDGGYITVTGTFTATNGGYLTVKMYPGEVTPTPTGTIGPGEPGYVPKSPLDSIIALLMMAGIESTDMAKLMFALLLCAVLAAVFGYYISFQASLIGMVIGFVGSTAMGLIQPWILLVIIFLGSIFLVSKWWFAGSIGG